MELKLLRNRIVEVYRSVYRFAPVVGYSQSMLSIVLHGQRKMYPETIDRMAKLLKIEPEQYPAYFGYVREGEV